MKGVDKRIDEGVLRLFGHVERMENDRIAKRGYVEECAGSCSMGRLQKRWIDNMKNCLGEIRLWLSLQLKGHKGENLFLFLSFISLLL